MEFSFYRPLKKAHLPPSCPRQAFRIVALTRAGIISAPIGVAPTYCLSTPTLVDSSRASHLGPFDRPVNRVFEHPVYPEPQNAPDVSREMNVPNFPEGKWPKAMDVSPWYGVYL